MEQIKSAVASTHKTRAFLKVIAKALAQDGKSEYLPLLDLCIEELWLVEQSLKRLTNS